MVAVKLSFPDLFTCGYFPRTRNYFLCCFLFSKPVSNFWPLLRLSETHNALQTFVLIYLFIYLFSYFLIHLHFIYKS